MLRNAAAVLLGHIVAVSAATLDVNQLVVFGDSLSDTGNDYIATGGAVPGPSTSYAPGRFTDGPTTIPSSSSPQGIWVDQLAPKLGLTSPLPLLAGGTNFAFGGAETGANLTSPGIIPSVDTQVAVGLAATGGVAPSNALYAFWAGSNDIFNHGADASVPVKAADDIYNNILAVAAAGGKDFLWFNLAPLGLTPKGESLGSQASAVATVESVLYNEEMALDVQKLTAAGIYVIPVDVFSIYAAIVNDFNNGCTVGPADPYCFANINTPAQGLAVDPNTYLFWDDFHPTTTGHALIADAAFNAIADSPEPASIALAAGGLIALALLGKRKSSRH